MRPATSATLALGVALIAPCRSPADELPHARSMRLIFSVQSITDAVLAHHADPPTRQHMIQSGIVGMYRAVGKPAPPGLGRRISGLTTPEQFAALMAEVRPQPSGDAPTEAALDESFLSALSDSVPGGVTVMEAKDRKVEEQMAANRYVGIQIAVGIDEASKLPVIQKTLEGGPAEKAGIKKDDVIEAVDGADLAGGSLKEYIDRLRGEEGTEVTVRVRRPGEKEPLSFRMTRAALPHETITGPSKGGPVRLPGPDPIGYLKVDEILSNTPRELRQAAEKLEAYGLKAVVIDLRGGSPSRGDLHSAVLLADELLDGGMIGRVRLADREVTYTAEPGAVFAGWPMAVLIDENTSGDREWLAAALQDNRHAAVVGSASQGYGLSHSTVPIMGGLWSITMATGLLERGDGRPLRVPSLIPHVPAPWLTASRPAGGDPAPSRWGVTPDHPAATFRLTRTDPTLNQAVKVMHAALSAPAAPKGGDPATPPRPPTGGDNDDTRLDRLRPAYIEARADPDPPRLDRPLRLRRRPRHPRSPPLGPGDRRRGFDPPRRQSPVGHDLRD